MNVTWSSQSKHASVTVIYSECAHGAFQTLSPDIIPVFLRRKKYGNLYCDCKELRDLPEGHKNGLASLEAWIEDNSYCS